MFNRRTLTVFSFAFLLLFGRISFVQAQSFTDILDLRIEAPYFSPNGDGIQDKVFFTPVMLSDWDVSRWRLEISDSSGKLVQRLSGAGFSTLIEWNGTGRKGE